MLAVLANTLLQKKDFALACQAEHQGNGQQKRR
jgi:hypothetical protein